jgi:hypothetical protein
VNSEWRTTVQVYITTVSIKGTINNSFPGDCNKQTHLWIRTHSEERRRAEDMECCIHLALGIQRGYVNPSLLCGARAFACIMGRMIAQTN